MRLTECERAANELLKAHNEIIDTWFKLWAVRERARITRNFRRAALAQSVEKK